MLQFELILLESATVPRDYCVGWGAFPVCNSEFNVNVGRFKCPLIFGAVNPNFDKFVRMEELWIKDLDNWLCNLYFEIEIVKLMDLKWSEEKEALYFVPPYQISVTRLERERRKRAMEAKKAELEKAALSTSSVSEPNFSGTESISSEGYAMSPNEDEEMMFSEGAKFEG